jgi:CHAT domain-containing protein
VGDRPELACLSDGALDSEAMRHGIQVDEGLFHAPSIRFMNIAAEASTGDIRQIKLLHIGDASNTLIGPWMEAAILASIPSLDVHSLLGAEASIDKFSESLMGVSIVIASCHGLYDDGGLLDTSMTIGAEGLSVADVAASRSLSNVEMLFLASCEMGRRSGSVYERESVSFSNAALVAGCRYVVAPILPVNDFVSAVLVSEFCQRVSALGIVHAYRAAVKKLEELTAEDFTRKVYDMWFQLKSSPLSATMPWPPAAIDQILPGLIDNALRGEMWRRHTFLFSRAASQPEE